MQTVDYIIKVNKDFKEAVDLLTKIAGKVKNKDELSSYILLLGDFNAAIDGIKNAKEALGGSQRDECAGYLVHKLMEVLMPASEEVVAE